MYGAFVVHGPDKVEWRAFQGDGPLLAIHYATMLPPRYEKEPPDIFPMMEQRSYKLLHHKIHHHGKIYHAYWSENWLDQWGVDEIVKFIDKESNVGSPPPREQTSGPAYPSSDEAKSSPSFRMEYLYGSMVRQPHAIARLGFDGV